MLMSERPEQTRTGAFFQLGYVVRDLDRAMKTFSRRGVERFSTIRDAPFQAYGQEGRLSLAMAYLGDLQIELIQPDLELPSIYTSSIPPDLSSVRLHHIGMWVEDQAEWDRVQDSIKRDGMPIAQQGSMPEVDWCYVDYRAETGHYIEYIWPHEGQRAYFASLPRFP